MDFMEEHTQFLHQYQQLEFADSVENGKPSEKADNIRNILTQLQIACENDMINDTGLTLLANEQSQRYAYIVDSLDEQTGLNNYAEGALTICSLHRNESEKWQSSLSLDMCRDMPCVQNVLAKNKEIFDYLLPTSKQDTVLISSGDGPQQKSHMEVNHVRRGPDTSSTVQNGHSTTGSSRSTSNNSLLGSGQAFHTRNTQKVFSAVHKPTSSSGSNNATKPSGIYQEADNRRPLFNHNGNFGAGNFGGAGTTTHDRKAECGVKRPFRESEQDTPGNQSEGIPGGPFRTAKEQLSIDNQKKYSKGQGQVSTSLYGNVKKSLGPSRRGPSSKFVPPVMNREEDNSNVGMNKISRAVLGNSGSGGGGGGGSGNQDEEPVDERLKGIEPKMIELIMNEIMDHGPHMTWDDIAGLEFAKKTIKEIVVWPMLRPDIFTGLRGPPKGLLLFGPPGTGKTLIGKCIASQSRSTFFSISASSLTSKWVGEGEKMVRALFAVARCNQPAVVFIDEIDSLLSQRSDGEHEASRRIKTEFLVQLDGAATVSDDRILVIGATNRPQEIDEAARRRFVKRLYIPLPEGPARKQIVLNLLSQQTFQLTESELDVIVQNTAGYSGADMSNLCREAALGPIRSMPFGDIENIAADQVRPILFEDFDAAFSQVRASVSDKDLDLYIEWNSMYGSAGTGK